MESERGRIFYKISISILLGLLGFVSNFQTIIFQFGDYTVAVLFGLIFPLLITLSWGWKYGLLSALAGGCQSMWWLWGPSNGYAIFLVVPPYFLWIVWHGFWAERRRKGEGEPWRLGLFLCEIPFRVLNSVNLLTLSRLAVSRNPPPWEWAVNSATSVPMSFSLFVVIKQASVALVLLLLADLVMNLNPVRAFFKLEPLVDQRRTGYVVSASLLLGCLYWIIDSLFHWTVISEERSFIDYFIRDIPDSNLFSRIIVLLFCLAFGMAISRILRRQKQNELDLLKAREEAVRREAYLSALFNTLPDLVWLKDREGRYLACNDRVCDFMGKSKDEIIGKNDYELINRNQAEDFRYYDRKVLQEGHPAKNETVHVFASDGHVEHVETIKAPMSDREGRIIGVLGIGRNVTERKNLEKQLVQAQKMESVGRLAGGVAHDFNNMIGVILGEADLMLEELSPDHPLSENIGEILNAAERSEKLTRQLLAFARKQTISPRIVNLNESVEGILKMLRRLIGENIDLEWTPGEDLWLIKADPAQIDQILANLCVNAGDAIGDYGKVKISTENFRMDDKACTDSEFDSIASGDYVVLRVSDTGCGMDGETREHIFEPFYTTKDTGKGTGLGLATVYGIMKQHKGWVCVESEEGKGSVFTLYFPRCTGKASRTEAAPEKEKPLNGHETIMLVEDETAMLEVMKRQLEKLGYRVLSFSDPLKAMEHCPLENNIDLLITDVIMPGMNGREVSLRVQACFGDCKCLFVSGYTADVIARKGIVDEGIAFLRKPFTQNVLARTVRDVLDNE